MRGEVEIVEVVADDDRIAAVLELAGRVLEQDRYLLREYGHARESHIVGAFAKGRCVGFLRFVVQVIGADVGRPPIRRGEQQLTEGYVEAFGVAPDVRRSGIGSAMQDWAAEYCRAAGCYQMRSRSPTTSTENYALKIAAGYTVHPSDENDSYYFMLRLSPPPSSRPSPGS